MLHMRTTFYTTKNKLRDINANEMFVIEKRAHKMVLSIKKYKFIK